LWSFKGAPPPSKAVSPTHWTSCNVGKGAGG
jgi:hypothetical protein